MFRVGLEVCEVNNQSPQNQICTFDCSIILSGCTCTGGGPNSRDQCNCCGNGIED